MGLLGFCGGLALMHFLFPLPMSTAGAMASETAAVPSGSKTHTRPASLSSSPSKERQRKAEPGRLSFTRSQWAKITGHPEYYQVSLVQCFPLEAPDPAMPRPFNGRGFLSDPFPSFAPQAELFGWNDEMRLEVRKQVLAYASMVVTAEQCAAFAIYPEPGVIRIVLSSAAPLRQVAVKSLRENLDATVGPRDAERFLSLANLEGASTPFTEHLEIVARPRDDGNVSITGFDGSQSVVSQSMMENPASLSGYGQRLEAMHVEVDWARLNPNAPQVEEEDP